MDLDEMPLLHEPDLMLAILRVAAGGPGTLDDCIDHLRALRDRAQVTERAPESEVRARLMTAKDKLRRARLIDPTAADRFRITARGRKVLADHPDGVDDSVLAQFAEFRAALAGRESPEAEVHGVPPPEYESGYQAYRAGAGLADNPHPPDVRAYQDWENGWSQGRDDDLR